MTSRLQRGRPALSQPIWFRLLAAFCLLLVAGVSTAQATHHHGQWLPDSAHHASLPADASQGQGEEHCPLCVAMHSAMPAAMPSVPEPVPCVVLQVAAHVERGPEKRWSFAMFSRPPPAGGLTHMAGAASETHAPAVMTAG